MIQRFLYEIAANTTSEGWRELNRQPERTVEVPSHHAMIITNDLMAIKVVMTNIPVEKH